MINLNWSRIQINSIEDLRQYFNLSEAMKTFLDGSLEKWLSDRYYDPQADALSKLDHSESGASVCAVCEALGVPYPRAQDIALEEREHHERNLAIVRRHTDDAETLANADALATDQNALAELLDAGKTIICLCAGSFTVPLRKGGIRYLLILYVTRIQRSSTKTLDSNLSKSYPIRLQSVTSWVETHWPIICIRLWRRNGYKRSWKLP